jgi:hypothetical protein
LDQVFRKPEKLHLNSGYSKWGILCKNVRHTGFFLLISAGNLAVIKTKWVSRLKGNLLAATKYIARKAWHARESNTTEVEWYIS